MLQTFATHLVAKHVLVPDVWSFTFSCHEPKEASFTPGQYMILIISQKDGTIKRKLYSISSSSKDKTSFDLLAKILPRGIGSDYLKKIQVNEQVTFHGPAGMFYLRENDRPKIFLAVGTGIAPILSILRSINIEHATWDVNLFWGLKTVRDLYYLEELKQLRAQNPNLKFQICLSREQNLDAIKEKDRQYFALGHVDAILNTPTGDKDYYLCGGAQIVDSLKDFLLEKKVPLEQMHFEKFV